MVHFQLYFGQLHFGQCQKKKTRKKITDHFPKSIMAKENLKTKTKSTVAQAMVPERKAYVWGWQNNHVQSILKKGGLLCFIDQSKTKVLLHLKNMKPAIKFALIFKKT